MNYILLTEKNSGKELSNYPIEMLEEEENESTTLNDSLGSSDSEARLHLPNLDGADTESSSESEDSCLPSVRKKSRRRLKGKRPHILHIVSQNSQSSPADSDSFTDTVTVKPIIRVEDSIA